MFVVSLQAQINRDRPGLYLNFIPSADYFWWEEMQKRGEWLESAQIREIDSLEELIRTFRRTAKGYVVYDENVPATSSAAATIAGADDLLVLRYDPDSKSLYQELTGRSSPLPLPVKIRLVGEDGTSIFTGKGIIPGTSLPSTGSAKNDVYRSVIERYLKPGKLNPEELGYYLDSYWLEAWKAAGPENHTLANLDYMIAQRGMIFDLHFEADEAPIDDPEQAIGTDFETVKTIFEICSNLTRRTKMIALHGFTPWVYKYTSHPGAGGGKDPVHVEWRKSQVASAYNIYVDADAIGYSSMTNASFFQHFPLPDHIPQVAKSPNEADLIKKGILDPDGSLKPVIYYAHYAGDYDAAAWVNRKMPQIWTDPNRGKLPLTWPLNPNHSKRFAYGMWWIRQRATENDVFVAGNSGAGYVNPYQLSTPREFSGLPSGVPVWEHWTLHNMKQWDLDVVGFVIDGHTPFMKNDALDAYSRFSPAGIGTQKKGPAPIYRDMPMLLIPLYLPPPDDKKYMTYSVPAMTKLLQETTERPAFLTVRSVLWSPSDFIELEEKITEDSPSDRMLVDQRTLLWLYKKAVEAGIAK